MNEIDLLAASDNAWNEFFHSLSNSGFTNEQIEKLDKLLNMKDCFNDVFSCLNGVIRT